MKTERLLLGLSLLNLSLLVFMLLPTKLASANNRSPVLRGRGLEIIDDRGRVRASIKVQPAQTFKATGRKYPETVVLRLIDPEGRPEVKIGASVEGGGLTQEGGTEGTQVHLQA